MQTGLMKKDRTFIQIPYYNIMKYAKVLCKNWCSESLENQKVFDEFSKDYKTYLPYLDFVIRKLGYALVNPLLLNKTLFIAKDDKAYLVNLVNNNKAICLRALSDTALNLRELSLPLDNCVIDKSGLMHCFEREERHPVWMINILNYYLTQDKELYYKYINFLENSTLSDLLGTIRYFMYENCGISEVAMLENGGLVVFANEANLTFEQIKLLKTEVLKNDGNLYENVSKIRTTKKAK